MTTVNKGIHGWTADSEHELDGKRVLRMYTMKSSRGGIVTNVNAGVISLDGRGFTYELFGDFNETVLRNAGRATEKTIRNQHEIAVSMIDGIRARALAYYAAKEPA